MSCSVPNCKNKIYARGWCRRHYRHVVEGGHTQPLPIHDKCLNCSKKFEPTAKSSGLCRCCYYKKWISDNATAQKEYKEQYREQNKNKIKHQIKKWRSLNKDKINQYCTEKRKNPHYRLMQNLRSRLYDFLKGKIKHKKTIDLTGCTFEQLIKHLEQQFQQGMTWENYGSVWVVDHIVPLCSVDLSDKKSLEKVCNFNNLRPEWYNINSSKATRDKLWKKIKK